MLSLVVLFTVFLGLVGVLILLNELQKKWNTASTLAPQLLREKVERWLESCHLHAPTPSELLPVINQRLTEWLQAEEREHQELVVEEVLSGTQLPEFKIIKIVSHSDTLLKLECDVEWPMCVPGLAVRVLPRDASTSVTCHLQVEWMYAHALVTMEKGADGVLLLSYTHTSPPMMGVSCGVENQTLDDQESAKLASSVTDGLQSMFTELSLDRVPMLAPAPKPLPVVLISTPEGSDMVCVGGEAHESCEKCESSGAGDGGGSAGGVGENKGVANGDLTVRDTEISRETQVVVTPSDGDTVPSEAGGAVGSDGSGAGEASVVGGESETGAVGVEGPQEDPPPQSDLRDPSHSTHPPPPTTAPTGDLSDPPHSTHPPPLTTTPTVADNQLESSDEPRPLSPGWRRSSSYEQLTNSLDTPSHSHVTDHMTTPERKALTMSMAGSEAESLYGADDRIPSTLVFEVKDSVRVRHIVALSSTQAGKLRRNFPNAQKLHIYNDHCFLATHLKEKVLCHVCKSRISGIFGKQAYTCRDCGLVVHKQCHFKAESLCSNSKLRTMNLIYPTTISTVSS